MKLGRKIVYILSLCLTVASGIWGGFFYGTGQYYIMLAINGVGTAAYQALIQLTVSPAAFCLAISRSLRKGLRFQRYSICSSRMSEVEWSPYTFSGNN